MRCLNLPRKSICCEHQLVDLFGVFVSTAGFLWCLTKIPIAGFVTRACKAHLAYLLPAWAHRFYWLACVSLFACVRWACGVPVFLCFFLPPSFFLCVFLKNLKYFRIWLFSPFFSSQYVNSLDVFPRSDRSLFGLYFLFTDHTNTHKRKIVVNTKKQQTSKEELQRSNKIWGTAIDTL